MSAPSQWPAEPEFQLVPTDFSAAMCITLRGKGFTPARYGGGHMAELWEIASKVGLPVSFPDASELSFRAENAIELLSERFDDIDIVRYEDELSDLRAAVTGGRRIRKHSVVLTARSGQGNDS